MDEINDPIVETPEVPAEVATEVVAEEETTE